MPETLFCTVVAKNYLAYARALAASLQQHHPEAGFVVFLCDRPDGLALDSEPFPVWTIEQLDNIAKRPGFCFKYEITELNTGIKPFFFAKLFERFQPKRLIYLDPDILLFSPLDEVMALLESHAAVLTPHLTAPVWDGKRLGEPDILLSGVYNLGFLGLAASETADTFLAWWQERLYDHCRIDHANGFFVDQRWVDLAPGLFGNFAILRDPRYNIAYWNLHERGSRLSLLGETVCLDSAPVRFFHYSGFNAEKLEAISRHQTRFTLKELPNLRPIYELYKARVLANGHEDVRKLPYSYGRFANGVTIPLRVRRLYRDHPDWQMRFPDPFGEDFFAFLTEPQRLRQHEGPPRLWWELHQSRPDLQAAFPDPFGADRVAYLKWVRENAALLDEGYDAALLPTLPAEETQKPRPAPAPLPPPTPLPSPGVLLATTPPPERVPVGLRKALGAPLKRALQSNPELLNQLYFWARGARRRPAKPAALTALPPAPVVPSLVNPRLPFGMNIAGYLAGEFGIGEASRALIHAVHAAHVPTALNNIIVANKRYEDKTFTEFTDENPYKINLVTVNADMVGPTVEAKSAAWFADRYNIGVWYWELEEFPEMFYPAFAPFDEIWVTSAFCAEAIARVSPVPVVKFTYPVTLSPELVHPDRARFGIPTDAFAFVFSFDFHSFVERKNPFAVARAFRKAFGERKDVVLVFKSINGDQYPERLAEMREAAAGCNVVVLDGYFSRDDTLSLFASCDALVSLHRAEGLGLGMAEAMALGKPVVATAYSGNMDFMDVNNSLPVRYELVPLTESYGPYLKGNLWAEPDVEHAAQQLRYLVDNPGEAAAIGARAARHIREKHNTTVTAQQITTRLKRLGLWQE